MGGGTILRSSFLLLSSICSRLPHLRVVGAIRLHSTQGQRPAIVTMPNDLIARLRCSPTLGKPSALDKDWFNLRTRPSPMPRADNRVSATPRPRRASLSLVLRETEEGKVEMLVIKRAANPRDKWSGDMALPGGRQEPEETELQAAVRECQEEVGISLVPSRFSLLGRLKDSKTSASKYGLTVACFVFVQTDKLDVPVAIQQSEVAFAWWVDTAMFYLDPVPREIGYPLTEMRKGMAKPHYKALARLFGAETLFFRCFYLPPPPQLQPRAVPGNAPLASAHINDSPDASTGVNGSPDASTRINDALDAKSFVLWGLTFGVVSDLVVAAGGRTLAFEDPPNFRFHSKGMDFLFRSYYKVTERGAALIGSIGSSIAVLRLRQ